MEKYEQLLNMIMDFNESVRFAAVSDANGNLLWNSQREGISNIVPIEKTKATMSRSGVNGMITQHLQIILEMDCTQLLPMQKSKELLFLYLMVTCYSLV